MNYLPKSILLMLVSMLALEATMGQITDTIELNLNSGDILVDPGTRTVENGDSVLWRIQTGETITSFNIVGAHHPFTVNLPNPDEDLVIIRAKINKRGPFAWKYRIKYKTAGHPSARWLDPIISIRPALTNYLIVYEVTIVMLSLVSLSMFALWMMERKKLKKFKIDRPGSL